MFSSSASSCSSACQRRALRNSFARLLLLLLFFARALATTTSSRARVQSALDGRSPLVPREQQVERTFILSFSSSARARKPLSGGGAHCKAKRIPVACSSVCILLARHRLARSLAGRMNIRAPFLGATVCSHCAHVRPATDRARDQTSERASERAKETEHKRRLSLLLPLRAVWPGANYCAPARTACLLSVRAPLLH